MSAVNRNDVQHTHLSRDETRSNAILLVLFLHGYLGRCRHVCPLDRLSQPLVGTARQTAAYSGVQPLLQIRHVRFLLLRGLQVRRSELTNGSIEVHPFAVIAPLQVTDGQRTGNEFAQTVRSRNRINKGD